MRAVVNEIMVPRSIIHRLTTPVLVLPHTIVSLTSAMHRGEVLFIQRGQSVGPSDSARGRMRSINHLAIQNMVLSDGDCVIRHGNKYLYHAGNRPVPPMLQEDIPLPVQNPCGGIHVASGWTLCFGDRVRLASTGTIVDPLTCIAWPNLQIGDAVLVVPRVGSAVLVNRQPTLVQESGFFLAECPHIGE